MTRRDDATFEALVRPCVDRLFRAALLLTGGDHQQAEDLVQITLAKLYVRRGWDSLTHPSAYLRQMLVNEHIGLRRRRSSTEVVVAELPDRPAPGSSELGTDAQLDLFRALNRLTRMDRTVVVLRYWEDLSVADTAAITGLSAGAVRTRSGRALAALRGHLDGYHPDVTVPAALATGPRAGGSR